jgi:hypothetical protein
VVTISTIQARSFISAKSSITCLPATPQYVAEFLSQSHDSIKVHVDYGSAVINLHPPALGGETQETLYLIASVSALVGAVERDRPFQVMCWPVSKVSGRSLPRESPGPFAKRCDWMHFGLQQLSLTSPFKLHVAASNGYPDGQCDFWNSPVTGEVCMAQQCSEQTCQQANQTNFQRRFELFGCNLR